MLFSLPLFAANDNPSYGLMLPKNTHFSSLFNHPNNLAAQGADYFTGDGARLGFLYALSSQFDFSLSYQPRVYTSTMTKYAGLFPNDSVFDYPPFGNVGLAWHLTPVFALGGDIEKIWGQSVFINNGSYNANTTALGPVDDLIYKIDAQYKIFGNTTVRVGVNHGSAVLATQYMTEDMATPDAQIRNVFTLGASEKISPHDFLNGIIAFIPREKLNNPQTNQAVELSVRSVGFGMSWSRVLG